MSGGVDSSVAAFLMQNRGYDCIGCRMELNKASGNSLNGVSLSDVADDAKTITEKLGIPYLLFDLSKDFDEKVVRPFVCAYLNGITPNPCIECNKFLKFGKLFEMADSLGCDLVVTGHYAIINKEDGRFVLKKAKDKSKDQSYVLYTLTQKQLARIVFPLGEFEKSNVRLLAEQNGFINAKRKDSQDICFIPDNDYASFIEKYTGDKTNPGDFIDADGNTLGCHNGIINYTIGQRRGLGISSDAPLYVKKIDPEKNTVTLDRNDTLFSRECDVKEVNWISGETPQNDLRCKVKIRYRHTEQPATVVPTGIDSVRVIFDNAQRAITPGQSAVFYDGENVLGGGKLL